MTNKIEISFVDSKDSTPQTSGLSFLSGTECVDSFITYPTNGYGGTCLGHTGQFHGFMCKPICNRIDVKYIMIWVL